VQASSSLHATPSAFAGYESTPFSQTSSVHGLQSSTGAHAAPPLPPVDEEVVAAVPPLPPVDEEVVAAVPPLPPVDEEVVAPVPPIDEDAVAPVPPLPPVADELEVAGAPPVPTSTTTPPQLIELASKPRDTKAIAQT